ncbi:Sorting nexin mvp1 [Coemansia erecta]|nr:Sorting nexin mvp1 [Coemansia erecta]
MGRVTYIHHYLPALYFALLQLAFELDYFFKRWRRGRFLNTAPWCIGAVVCLVFLYFAPFTYGWNKPAKLLSGRKWLSSWNIYEDFYAASREMSDLYDILNPWGPSGAGGPEAGNTSDGDLLGSSILKGDASRMCLGLKAGGGRITREALQKVLGYSGLPRHVTGQIILAADTGAPMMSQRDFNLALAMAALAQKNMSPSIENVVFHKDDLPEPDLKGVAALATEDQSAGSEVASSGQDSEGSPAYPSNSDDPWFSTSKGSTAMAAPTSAMAAMALSNDGNASSSTSHPPPYSSTNGQKPSGRASVSNGTNAQGSVPSINMEGVQWQLDLEDVSIKESAEKGGIVFKHTNYEVSTRSFTAMVVRRYNDFFWISNYLVKRYPYRMHPNIPPKGFPDE